MSTISVWNPAQWKQPEVGEALKALFEKMGYASKIDGMVNAFQAAPSVNLEAMKEATGNTVESTDVNYVWTSKGRMALLLEPGRNQPEQVPLQVSDLEGDVFQYDPQLRAWTADLGVLHQNLIKSLKTQIANGSSDTADLERDLELFDIKNICDEGDWDNGISVSPRPKFYIVTQFLKKYFSAFHDAANKLVFYKAPSIQGPPPFLQIKKHRMCIFFKGKEKGSITVNPELAEDGTNSLRSDLPDNVYDRMQFTVEIIGGKTEEFPNGLAGKLTCLDGQVCVLPMSPANTKVFNPSGTDDGCNSYVAFKNSHPDTE